jgi:hypothetical protein
MQSKFKYKKLSENRNMLYIAFKSKRPLLAICKKRKGKENAA